MLILFFLFLEIIYLALASVYNRLLDKNDAKMYLLGKFIYRKLFVIVPINVVNKEVVNVIRVISCFS